MPPRQSPDTTKRDALAERLQGLLTDEPSVREKAMFGSRAFMVRGKLVACAFKHGHLLVRVDAEHESQHPGGGKPPPFGSDTEHRT